LLSEGGFGGTAPLIGRDGGIGAAVCEGGFGGGGMNGRDVSAGASPSAAGAAMPALSLVVSFFGETPAGGMGVMPLLPGRLIRTVSRFAVGVSGLAGSVMRIVSAFAASSADSEGAGGISSAIKEWCQR
jgi:hypothetical protein